MTADTCTSSPSFLTSLVVNAFVVLGLISRAGGVFAQDNRGLDEPALEERAVPQAIASFVGESKELLAYKAVGDGSNGKAAALITRYPKEPDPGLEMSADDRVPYACELILLHMEKDKLRVTGRSAAAVDCEVNEINRKAEHLELSDQIDLSARSVTFMNENIRGGSYSYAFAFSDGRWHLSGATDFYKTFEERTGEVLIAKETAAYPRDFGLIPMEMFTPDDIGDVLHKNRTLLR